MERKQIFFLGSEEGLKQIIKTLGMNLDTRTVNLKREIQPSVISL